MGRRVAAMLALAIVAVVTSPLIVAARATRQAATSVVTSASGTRITPSTSEAGTSAMATAPMAARAARDSGVLVAALQQLVTESGATVGVTVVELGGSDPLTWSLDGGTSPPPVPTSWWLS